MAFETSRLLIKAGHHVDLVVMIDPVTLRRSARLFLLALDLAQRAAGFTPEQRRTSLGRAWARLAKLDKDLRLGRLTRRWKELWTKQGKAIGRRQGIGRQMGWSIGFKGATSQDTGTAKRDRARPKTKGKGKSELMEAYSRIIPNYHPSRLAVPVLYIALGYSGDVWRRISPEIEFINAPGLHSLKGDSMEAILNRVRARLDALDAPSKSAPYRAVHGLVETEPFI